MSKPKFLWWGYAINVAKDLQWYKETEQLGQTECRERDALLLAIEKTKRLPQGEERLSVVGFVYWSGKKQTIQEVADCVGVPEATAKEWHGDFIRLIGEGLGFDINRPSKKRGPKPKKLPPDQMEDLS